MEICSQDQCTGCGACAYVCPKLCITMSDNLIGVIYPKVNDDECINCGKCKKICPALHKFDFKKPIEAYAAWSSDPEERRTSASGGVAAELYKYALKNQMMIVGAKNNDDFSVSLVLTDNYEDYREFKNSKYVFSTAYGLFPNIKSAIDSGKKILMIGLACQIAAVKQLFPNSGDKIIFVELVCHGATPVSYIRQHIAKVENSCHEKAAKISYRDSEYGTPLYMLTLYNQNGDCIYAKRTVNWDSYQVGYHRAISYRENCYNCKYAHKDKISDIVLSDYKGLGTYVPWEYDKEQVSSVLIYSENGKKLIHDIIKQKNLIAYERPVDEPIQSDTQLRQPSQKSKSRYDFEKEIVRFSGDFESAMEVVIRKRKIYERRAAFISILKKPIRLIKRLLK